MSADKWLALAAERIQGAMEMPEYAPSHGEPPQPVQPKHEVGPEK